MKRHLLGTLPLVGLLMLLASFVAPAAYAQYPGPQGQPMFSANCAGSAQFGTAYQCWDTGNQWMYYWNGTAFTPTGNNVTVAKLPTCGASQLGLQQIVTDSTTVAAEGQTCAGTSTHKALAVCLESVWKCF